MARPEPVDFISPEAAGTLDGLLRERAARSPGDVGFRRFDERAGAWEEITWARMAREVARWQAALEREGLAPGDRVAIMMRNRPEWAMYDLAALGLGLVTVPLYTVDRPDNAAYVVQHSGSRVLLLETVEQWNAFRGLEPELSGLKRILCLEAPAGAADEPRLRTVGAWLPDEGGALRRSPRQAGELATIIYTSGTTGRPKGVMLSHRNILSNCWGCLQCVPVRRDDLFLSFLPLSHTFERTVGYYLAIMSGTQVAYARSIPQLAEDLQAIRPTGIIAVPRIFERVHGVIRAQLDQKPPVVRKLFSLTVDVGWDRFQHAQGRGPWKTSFLLWPLLDRLVASKVRARFGGRLRVADAGGAALSPDVSRVFIALGINILQGYGLTEAGPVVCFNRPDRNEPASVGHVLPGVEVKLNEQGALLVRGPNVMLGYWDNPEATRAVLSEDGWLNTGDKARIDETGRIYITGRIKEIIVLSNGEKVSPVDMEAAIARDALFEQVLVLGEGKPYLSVLAVLNGERWAGVAKDHGLDARELAGARAEQLVLERIGAQIRDFPGYAQVRRAAASLEPWSIENGLLTPTLKLKRARVVERHREEVERVYAGH
ncbi:MAG TPA: long-chain fatty acid--CoA ligase [Burkholderiales bacterium]|nr:long-chain fatty acid--CoA ligase [Burkholderiales bacterium]